MGKNNNQSGSQTSTTKTNIPYKWAPDPKIAETPIYTFMGKDVNSNTAFNDYVNALYEPTKQNLTDTYYSNLGSAINKANASGTLNSLGFQNYRSNQLDKNYANALSNAYNSAQLSANDYINNLKTQDFQNQFNNAAMYNDYISNMYDNYNNYNLSNTTTTGNSSGKSRTRLWGII